MAIILAYERSTHPNAATTEASDIKHGMEAYGDYWAELVLTGIRDGKKPEILIDRSGSMEQQVIDGITRMDVARALMVSLAQKLREKAPDFDLNQIPVKSWGTGVYDEDEVVMPNISPPTCRPKTTRLADFKQNELGTEILPHIPCTDGTRHSLWLNESTFPLVFTDDLYKVLPEFVENYRNFAWCDGNNIVAIDGKGHEPRMRRLNQKIRNAAMGYDAINMIDLR